MEGLIYWMFACLKHNCSKMFALFVYFIVTCPRPPFNDFVTTIPCQGGDSVVPGEICFAYCPYDYGTYRIKCMSTGTWSGLESCQPGMIC